MNEAVGSTTLHTTKRSAILLLIGCIVFVVVGIMLGNSGKWFGYLGSAFFALGIPVAIIQLIPGSSYLEIGADGFEICSFFRKRFVPWSTVRTFRVIDVTPMSPAKTKRVGFDLIHTSGGASAGQEFAKGLAGSEDMLPDTYGIKAEELVDIMNGRLAKARRISERGDGPTLH